MFFLQKPRILVSIILALALPTLMSGCGGAKGVSALLQVVGVKTVLPKSWSEKGEWVQIVADIVSGESLTRVIAKVAKRNAGEIIDVILNRNSDGKYVGSFEATPDATETTYTAVVTATDTTGNTTTSEPVSVDVPPAQ